MNLKMKQILRKTLLVLVAGVLSSAAWSATIVSLGDDDKGWTEDGCNTSYTVKANKTLTLNFTLTSTEGKNETQGYFVQVEQSSTVKMQVQPGGGYNVNNKGWWIDTDVVKYDRDWATLGDFTTFGPGSTVELTIKRIHQQILYFADITTSSTARHYLRVLTKEIVNEDDDIVVKLGADHASLSNITDVFTDESIKGELVGKEDNSVDFNGVGAAQKEFTLGADETLTMNFINYSSKIGWGDNWMIEIQNGTKYLDLRADFYGWEAGMAGEEHYYVRTEDTTQPTYFELSSSSGLYFDNFPKALHKAYVNLEVKRVENKITITAVQNCTSGIVKTEKYTLTHNDFTTGNVTVRLLASYSHLDLLPANDDIVIGATKWGTYVSEFPLDFTGITTIEAYKVTGATGSAITKEQLTGIVPAGTPMLLNAPGGANTYPVPVATTPGDAVTGNCLKAGTGAAVAYDGSYDRYVLVNNSGTAVFKIIGSSKSPTVATNRAYLEFSVSPSRDILSIDGGDATGINMVNGEGLRINGSEVYYNLQGQRVLYPTKGLYIVNGKKVIIK